MKTTEVKSQAEMSMCGYRCDLCKAYTPNVQRQDERAELSRVWEKYYGFHVPPEKIICDGCRCTEPGARQLDAGCPVRACVIDKDLSHCGGCADYPCGKFNERIGLSSDNAKSKQPESFDEAEYSCFLAAYDNLTRLDAYRQERYNG